MKGGQPKCRSTPPSKNPPHTKTPHIDNPRKCRASMQCRPGVQQGDSKDSPMLVMEFMFAPNHPLLDWACFTTTTRPLLQPPPTDLPSLSVPCSTDRCPPCRPPMNPLTPPLGRSRTFQIRHLLPNPFNSSIHTKTCWILWIPITRDQQRDMLLPSHPLKMQTVLNALTMPAMSPFLRQKIMTVSPYPPRLAHSNAPHIRDGS